MSFRTLKLQQLLKPTQSEQCLAPGTLSCHEYNIRQFKEWITGDVRSAFRQNNCEIALIMSNSVKTQLDFIVSLQQSKCYVSNYFLPLCLIVFINKMSRCSA